MNKINNKQIQLSIEMKDKWLNSIFKKSRKLSSLDKFWNLVIEEMGFFHFSDLKNYDVYISTYFLKQLKEQDQSFDNDKEYANFSPLTHSEISPEDFSVYLTHRNS